MERNIGLDYFKIFLSILVITIHMQPLFGEGEYSGWVISNGVARLAVPVFFIINGFFVFSKLDDFKAFRKYVKHLLLIYSAWTVIYAPFFITTARLKDIAVIILTGYYHLWYMPAAIIGVILLYYAKKYIKNDYYILLLALVMYITGYIYSYYAGKIFYYRNGFTIGFAFVVLGYFIKSQQLEKKIKDIYIILLVVAAIIAGSYESCYRFLTTGGSPFQDFTFSLLLSPSLFILVIKHPIFVSGKGFINTLSSGIYFLHPIAITIAGVPDEYKIYKLPLVFIITTILSFIIYLINKRIKIFF